MEKDVLTEHEKLEIDKEIAKFPKKHNACLDALMVVQKNRGYISDDSLKAVANYLEMSATELDGIATFYNLIFRRPVGRCVIRLCDSVSCWIMGYPKLKQELSSRLNIDWGETSFDQAFTLLPAQCLGACDKAPVMMINDETYTHVTSDKLDQILKAEERGANCHDATPHRNYEKRSATAKPSGVLIGGRV